jgi:hypothetical protein
MQFLLGTPLTEQCVMKLLNFVYELNITFSDDFNLASLDDISSSFDA